MLKIINLRTAAFACVSLLCSFAQAQEKLFTAGPRLWGITTKGGSFPCVENSGGTIFSLSPDGSAFAKHLDYNCAQDTSFLEYGKKLYGSLLRGTDNRLYGLGVNIELDFRYQSERVWPLSNGTAGQILSLNIEGGDPRIHYDRLNIHRRGDMFQASNGDLYVSSVYNFNIVLPDVFGVYPSMLRRFNPDGSTDSLESIVMRYAYAPGGRDPWGTPIELPDGYIYGTTLIGGSLGRGIIYKVRLDGSDFKVLHNFTIGCPRGGVIDGKDGYLYGMDYRSYGTIYKIRTDGTGFTTMHTFGKTRANGRHAEGELLEFDGRLYGMTSRGGAFVQGTIFSIEKDGTNFTILHSFNDGAEPLGPLTVVDGSYFYGMTSAGGANNLGVIFKIRTDGTQYTKIFDFSNETGGAPNGRLLYIDDSILENEDALKVYPNPSTASFRLSNDSNGPVSFEVTDMNGTQLQLQRTIGQTESVEIGNDLPKGFYLLKTTTNEGVKVHRLVKN